VQITPYTSPADRCWIPGLQPSDHPDNNCPNQQALPLNSPCFTCWVRHISTMASRGGLIGFFVITAVSIATLWQPLLHRVQVLGFTRSQASIQNSHPDDQLIKILNTVHCEDLHYHHASNMLYTACEGAATPRNHWFPPLGHMSRHEDDGPGKIVLVDPSVGTLFSAKQASLIR